MRQKKIILSCLAINAFIACSNSFCAAPKENQPCIPALTLDSIIREREESNTSDSQSARSIQQKQQSPLANLSYMIQKLDRDDVDMLWAKNLKPIPKNSIANQYKKQFGDKPQPSTPNYIPIQVVYKEFNSQEDMPENAAKIIFPDKTTHLLKGHPARVMMDSHHPSRDILATGSIDGTIIIWNIKTKKIMAQFKNEILPISPQHQKLYSLYGIFFSNDGSMLQTMNYDSIGNALESFYGSPFNILTFDQTILLSMIQNMFKEKHTVTFAELADRYKKDKYLLESLFKTFDPKAQEILKAQYFIKDDIKPDTSAACAIQ